MRIDQTTARRRRSGRLACAGLLAIVAAWPLSAIALGLGEPMVESHLGARLQVKIPLTLDSGERADEIKVSFASAADRARFGAGAEQSPVQLRLAVVTTGRAGASIAVTSAASVREPALTFVIEVKSESSRFMREYTVLLDPIDYRATLRTDSRSPRETKPTNNPIVARRPASALSAAAGGRPVPRPIVNGPNIDGDQYGPVSPGDTLSGLGAKLRADRRVSVPQMSIALFDANPQAFSNNDVNRLIAGSLLRVPSRDESTAIDPRAARERLYGPAARRSSPAESRVTPSIPPTVAASPTTRAASAELSDKVTDQTAEAAVPEAEADESSNTESPEPNYRLSILTVDPPSDVIVADAISRLAGSKDIAVRDLVTRLETAREDGSVLARGNQGLRERIATADERIGNLAKTLRERNERVKALQIAIEAASAPAAHSTSALASTAATNNASAEQRSERLPATAWQQVAQLAGKVSPLAWLAVVVVLWGLWLLVRRNHRRRNTTLQDYPIDEPDFLEPKSAPRR